MRLAGIGHIEDVAWAILETQGKISFIQRSQSGGAEGGGEEPPPNPRNGEDDGLT
jgi:uncharacterized membrane protein YcaP (DUF421 family)